MKPIWKKRSLAIGNRFNYCECGKKITIHAERCKSCSNRHRAGTYKFSEESKKSMSEKHFSKKDIKRSKRIYKKIGAKLKGRSPSNEVRNKISMGNKGKHYNNWCKGLTKETDIRIRNTAKKISEKTRGKKKPGVSDWRNKALRSGLIKPPMLGKRHTTKSRKKMSKSRKGKYCGKENANWKGGVSLK